MSAVGLEKGADARQSYIDGLRAVAIVAIVLFHADARLAPGGFVGVDVFFVISGFLITRIIAGELAAKTFSFGRFYLRRARRILPAYVAMAAVCTLCAYAVLMPQALTTFGGSLAASALFILNFVAAPGPGYFEAPLQQAPLIHLWSLAVEEQFYLVWPVTLFAVTSAVARRRGMAATGFLIVISLTVAQLMVVMNGSAHIAFFMFPTRAWEFLIGAALVLGLPGPVSRGMATAAVGGGLALILASVALLTEATPFPGFAALPPVLGAALVIWGGEASAPWATAPLRWRPVVRVGLISYSLYLLHWPLLVFNRLLAEQPPTLGENLALVAASVPLAWASWRFIEQPWRVPAIRPRPWRAVAAVLSLALLFGAGAAAFYGKGLPGRLNPAARTTLQAASKDINPWREHCLLQRNAAPPQDCRSGPPTMPAKVIVWGDSHADAITPGVFAWAKSHGLAVRETTMGGCPPLIGVRVIRTRGLNCVAFGAAVLKAIEAEPDLSLIVLAARWPLYMDATPKYDPGALRVTLEQADGPGGVAFPLDGALDQTLAAIAATGTRAKVVVVGPIPELTFSVPSCEVRALQLHWPVAACRTAPAEPVLQRARPAEARIAQALARHPGVAGVTPSATLCHGDRCAAMIEGRAVYYDDDHLSASGAARLVPPWLDVALGRDGWTDTAGLAGAGTVSTIITQTEKTLRLVSLAARVAVITEDRPDYQVRFEGVGARDLRVERDGQAVTVHGGWLSRFSPGCGAEAADLPLVTIRAPRNARITAEGATFGEIGPSASLSLTVKGCGRWRAGPSGGDLAISTNGPAQVRAAGVVGRLIVKQAGGGRVAVDAGQATTVSIESVGRGQVDYGGDTANLAFVLRGKPQLRLGKVSGQVDGSNDGAGRVSYERPGVGHICDPCS